MPMPPLTVPAEWLAEHRDEVVVADVRWFLDGRDGHRAYREGHVPGAVFTDLDADLSAPPSRDAGRHPLPTPEAFAAAMSRRGIGDDDVVVAYDQGSGATAARLVWMLRVTGRAATLLDGGLASWPGDLETGDVTRAPAVFTPRPWPSDAIADADDVARAATSATGVVIDARAAERYRGEVEPVDTRAGHVPGAVNVPHADNVDTAGRLHTAETLRARYARTGADTADEVIVYCGSGVTACHDVLALEQAGIRARLFPGSWSAWSGDPSRPVATGPDPT